MSTEASKDARERRDLTAAAVSVLGRDGLNGVTHAAVAAEAGMSLQVASGHFPATDDLIMAAIQQANAEFSDAIQADKQERSLAGLARLLARELLVRPRFVVAGYEFYMLAMTRRDLRPVALLWLEEAGDTFVPDLEGPQRRAFLAALEGLVLHALLDAHPSDATEIEATLRAAVPQSYHPS